MSAFPGLKRCSACKTQRDPSDFNANRAHKDGLDNLCRECRHVVERLAVKRKKPFEPDPLSKEQIRDVMVYMTAHKSTNVAQIARETKIDPLQLQWEFTHHRFLSTWRMVASGELAAYVPLALRGVRESLLSYDPDVKLRASLKVLEAENIIGPQKLEITVDDFRSKSAAELRAIIDEAKAIPTPVFEAQLIGDGSADAGSVPS